MAVEHNRSDETSLQRYQLPLPWEPPWVPPQASPSTPTVQPQQVWPGLAPREQRHLHQALVRVIQEVLRDANGH